MSSAVKTVFETAMMTVPYEELTSVVKEYPRAHSSWERKAPGSKRSNNESRRPPRARSLTRKYCRNPGVNLTEFY